MIVTGKREGLGRWPGLAAGAPMLNTDEANRRDSSYADAGGDRALILHNRLKSLRIGGQALSD
jgi:hypothetical protein